MPLTPIPPSPTHLCSPIFSFSVILYHRSRLQRRKRRGWKCRELSAVVLGFMYILYNLERVRQCIQAPVWNYTQFSLLPITHLLATNPLRQRKLQRCYCSQRSKEFFLRVGNWWGGVEHRGTVNGEKSKLQWHTTTGCLL